MDKTKVIKDVAHTTLIIEREFAAPVEKLWKFYAEKELFEKWWGPEGWQTETKEFDFKIGGNIHYGMKCVDENQGEWFGQTSWGLMTIKEIDQPHTITMEDVFANEAGQPDPNMPAQRFVVEFVATDVGTLLRSKSILNSVEEMEQLIKMGMIEGFDSQMNKLDELLK